MSFMINNLILKNLELTALTHIGQGLVPDLIPVQHCKANAILMSVLFFSLVDFGEILSVCSPSPLVL